MAPKRILELDIFRGIAILLVMGVHVPAYPIWSMIGGWGVDLFFVLSGFLISNLLFTEYRETGDIRMKRFFVRRAMKLYPSFYLMLAVTVVYCVFWNVPFRTRDLIGEMVLTQNYIGSIWGHTWSLAVEEHFYIFLPIVLVIMMKLRKGAADPFRAIPYLFLGVASLCLLLRYLNAYPVREFSHRAFFQPSHLRIDSLLCGVFLSYLHNFRPEIVRKLMSDPWRFPISLVSVAGLIPAFILPIENPIVYTIGFTLIYISFGTMLLLSLYKETNRKRAEPGRIARGIARIGIYSYPLYLWHVPMAQLFVTQAGRFGAINQYLWHAIYFAASMAVGIGASKLVELPILKIRERIVPLSNSPEPEVEFASVN